MPPEAAIFFRNVKNTKFSRIRKVSLGIIKKMSIEGVCEGVMGGSVLAHGYPPLPPHCPRVMSMKPYTPNLRKNITLLEDLITNSMLKSSFISARVFLACPVLALSSRPCAAARPLLWGGPLYASRGGCGTASPCRGPNRGPRKRPCRPHEAQSRTAQRGRDGTLNFVCMNT